MTEDEVLAECKAIDQFLSNVDVTVLDSFAEICEYVFFSIIIPIYNNKEKEMADCFASISQQQYKDFEVIVIDDGSNETCARNIDRLSKRFSHVTE